MATTDPPFPLWWKGSEVWFFRNPIYNDNVGVYNVPLVCPEPLAEMADETTPPKTEPQIQEEWAAVCLDGGKCTKSEHAPLTEYQQIYLFRQLRLRYPHLSSNPQDLERELNRLAKKLK